MCLSRPFKRLSFFSLAEKRLLRDFTCGDQHSLLSNWTPRHVVLETKDSSLGPKQMFGKGPIKFFLDNNIRSVFAGCMMVSAFFVNSKKLWKHSPNGSCSHGIFRFPNFYSCFCDSIERHMEHVSVSWIVFLPISYSDVPISHIDHCNSISTRLCHVWLGLP